MGKHDTFAHQVHVSKKVRFNQPKPILPANAKTLRAPQEPKPGTQSFNQFR